MKGSRIGYHPFNKGLRNNRAIGERATRLTQNIEISSAQRNSPETSVRIKRFPDSCFNKKFNKSWDEMMLPEDWKLAHIASIFKKEKIR